MTRDGASHLEPRLAWAPLLDASWNDQVQSALSDIEATLSRVLPGEATVSASPPDVSLGRGWAGVALFFAYLHQATHRAEHLTVASRFLDGVMEAVARDDLRVGLYTGLAGIAWSITHLRPWLFDTEDSDPVEDLDEPLLALLGRPARHPNHDLISGLAGIGLYSAQRSEQPLARACLERTVDRFAEFAEIVGDEVTWSTLTSPDVDAARKYDLGVAHGVPGVIAVLAQAHRAGVRKDLAKRLLDGAVAWLLRQMDTPRVNHQLPYWVEAGVAKEGRRDAWCYGRPGVAIVLLHAARRVGEPAWEKAAIALATAAARTSREAVDVNDAGLCHGSAGLGLIYGRLFQETGLPIFHDAARTWFEHVLEHRRDASMAAGFPALELDDQDRFQWVDRIGLLEGTAGVGLALISASTAIEPDWDQALLLSVPKHLR